MLLITRGEFKMVRARMNMFFLAWCSLFFAVAVMAQENQIPAFPGAEGHGRFTTGGRGGQVIYVTTLEDNGSPGSLRYAVNQTGARLVLFKISGTIQLKSALKTTQGDLTIAGQTAPGDGICLRDYPVEIQADNVILRYLRFRMGDATNQEADALWGRNRKNIIIDHCSISWSTDECASFYDNENFTLQWSILSESLRNSVHGKGAHGYGGIWGGRNASFHHNLLASHDSRNPRFNGSRYSNRPDDELVDFRNNVVYNWGSNSAYAAEGGRYNLVNNYYKAGPATASSKTTRIIEPYADNGSNNQPAGTYGTFYVEGNKLSVSAVVSGDNWQGVHLHSSFSTYAPGVTKADLKLGSELPTGGVTTHSAEQAYEKVLDFVGACLVRDTIDKRVIHDVRTGTATITDGGNGSTNGIIDTQSAVGGWPELHSTNAPADTDADGMPDVWEAANNLNSNNASDAKLTSLDGKYTNVEVYLYSLVASITENQKEDGVTTSVKQMEKRFNPLQVFYNPGTNELSVSHDFKIEKVQVYSITGVLIYTEAVNQKSLQLNVPIHQQGIYLLRIQDEKKQVFAEKFRNY